MDIERFKEFDALRPDDEVRTGSVECIQPQHADKWPENLHPSVRAALDDIGMGKPYKHQFDAVAKSLNGADVVLESPTASGKTLAFTVPIVHALKTNPGSHALMIYPMKALAFDQHSQIQQLCEPLGVESWTYDGDTDEKHRKVLRENPPPVLLTNPDYLNRSFLGSRKIWDKYPAGEKFLRNLRYVVIDEMHEYNGFFGSNVALLLRRFFLYLDRIGALLQMQVFLSTATCANPKEHAENLTGRDVEVVSARNVLRPKRHFLFVKPDIPDFRYRDILRLRVENAALCAFVKGLQTLVFCPTKKFLEEAFGNCQRRAKELDLDPQRISAFHADLKNVQKREIQQKIKAGEISVVFTTNALELGLDIGGLDGIILAGFPPRLSSAWQQIGRAGRSWKSDAFVLFYAMNDPIDRFFVGNLDAFLNKPFDELVVDPANEVLIQKHLPSLMEEVNGQVNPSDEAILGSPFYSAAQNNPGTIPPGYQPQAYLDLHGGIGRSFKVRRVSEELGQISEMRRFREAYIGAVFTFFGRKYLVHSHETDAVVLTDVDPHMKTEAMFFTVLTTNDIFKGHGYGKFQIYHGSLNIIMNFTGYKLVDERNGSLMDTGGGGAAHCENNLHAFWINASQGDDAVAGIGALEHLIRVGAMFVIPADRFDASTHSKAGDEPTASYYENYSGGIGVARKLFEVWPTALRKGIEIAESCRCRSGCANCIEPAKSYNVSKTDIDKRAGIKLAHLILKAADGGPDSEWSGGMMVPV